jgi:multidrug resistance efflux pump
MWLGVGGLTLLVSALVVWSFVAQTVETTKTGVSLVPRSGLSSARVMQAGVIDQILVEEGEFVERGQPLVTILTGVGEQSVVAPVEGLVAGIDAVKGQVASAGDELVVLAPLDFSDQAAAIGFVRPEQLGQLEIGQSVTIQFPTANPQTYGRMKGTLSFVAATPVLRSRLRQILPDTQANAAYQQGPFYEIAIDVERADTPSGFAWTIGNGPPDQIYLASNGVAFIAVSRQSIASKAFG